MLKLLHKLIFSSYFQTPLALTALVYLAFTLTHWIRKQHANSEQEQRFADDKYVDSISCFGRFVLVVIGFVVCLFVFVVVGATLVEWFKGH